ncbi:MAG: alanine--tRNA ligase [Synergistales bacterium]|nr:alanine--tRNA ligase [Synergistales bacterium]
MQWRTGSELRKLFIDFWISKGSKHYPSFSLVPDDPTLLFTIAGMVPFKMYYLGMKQPEHPTAVTSQKCVRTNDIDNVGRTARHHTFFEMLGNFAWGDYFKKEAITWAWEFLTERVGLDPEKMYATIYLDDEEAFDVWHRIVGLPPERIYRFGEDENYWFMGNTGPCGPCSEILYDQGPEFSCGESTCDVGCSCDRYLEIWNLVFTQYDRQEDGSLKPLPKKNIDTGMGLERLTSLVQKVRSDFETDLFRPLIDKACNMTGVIYGSDPRSDLAVRVISDHVRSIAFMIADGILPSNEGQGYVLRRLLRRAVRYGRLIGLEKPFLCEFLPLIIKIMGDPYSELMEQRLTIEQVIDLEEKKFSHTLEQGTNLLDMEISRLQKNDIGTLNGELAFTLYDTYGFPLELTREICDESGLHVDEDGFMEQMNKQKERARAASKHVQTEIKGDVYSEISNRIGRVPFTGYDSISSKSSVVAIVKDGKEVERAHAGDRVHLILSPTPFYAERGGQVGDTGTLRNDAFMGIVLDTFYAAGDLVVQDVLVENGELAKDTQVFSEVDVERRWDIRRNHTATHLLHESLQKSLGGHVRQSGSLVSPEILRFDFTHFQSLSKEQLNDIEGDVNRMIMEDKDLSISEGTMVEAKKRGAKALFEEKYGDTVRIVEIPDICTELCGGIHVDSTGQIGSFKIIKEESIGSGIRRVIAVTGRGALAIAQGNFDLLEALKSNLGVDEKDLISRLAELQEQVRLLRKKNEELYFSRLLMNLDKDLNIQETEKGINIITGRFSDITVDLLRELGDEIRLKYPASLIILALIKSDGNVQLLAMADKMAMKAGVHAGKIVKVLATTLDGGGGGNAQMAQAGGKDPLKIDQAFSLLSELVKEQIGN